jgi:hypothetical protein
MWLAIRRHLREASFIADAASPPLPSDVRIVRATLCAALLRLAVCDTMVGPAEKLELLEEAQRLEPKSADVQRALAITLNQQGQLEASLEHAVAREPPSHPLRSGFTRDRS